MLKKKKKLFGEGDKEILKEQRKWLCLENFKFS